MKIGIYGRVSTRDKQEVENQLVQLREFAAKQGWTISREYIDRETGATSDREQFQAMFTDASRRKFGLLLFWSLDRLSREGVLETLQHLNRLTACGVGYKSYTEQYLDSCGIFKDAVIGILAVVAKQERVRLSERTRAGIAMARSRGRRIGRPRLSRCKRLRSRAYGPQGFLYGPLGASLAFLRVRFAVSHLCLRKKGLSQEPAKSFRFGGLSV